MRSSLTTDHIFTVVPTAGRSSASRWRIPARGVDVRLRALKWDILAAVEAILDSGIIEKGPYNKQLAQAFQAMCGAPYAGVPCDSGTDASNWRSKRAASGQETRSLSRSCRL